MFGKETVSVALDNDIAIVTLNRPDKLNALNYQMFAEIREVFAQLRFDSQVRAVVLTGAGRAFCAGGDVSELQTGELVVEDFPQARRASKEMVLELMSFEKPVIGAINGIAAGGGVGLLLCCDVVFASEAASFSVIFRRIGMIPDCGTLYLLPRLIGPAEAKRLVFTGEIVDADEMLRLGIAQKVVAADQLIQEALSFARQCSDGPIPTLGIAKQLIDKSFGMSAEQLLDLEALALPGVMHSADYEEGVAAFLEKRPAQFGQC